MSIISSLRSLFAMGRGVIGGLSEKHAGGDPILLFQDWFATAKRSGSYLPEAMAVATSTADGWPAARMMLLKGVDDRGFVFYTNYESRKAIQLLENPRAALVFHWARLQRQVRVEGTVEKIPAEESQAYFNSRPRGSRVGTWASKQSTALESREELERRFREFEARFKGHDVPLPPFWGGLRLTPHRIEFWQGRINRLHDRLCYTREGQGWKRQRFYP